VKFGRLCMFLYSPSRPTWKSAGLWNLIRAKL
jgi:hypothetical protein